MKKFCMLFAVASVGILMAADIELPLPAKTGGMPLQEALAKRKTIRKYSEAALPDALQSALLWSANGVNRPDGKRTAPSARDRREIEIYVLRADGGFFYDPARNVLVQKSDADLRQLAGGFKAPLYLLLVADARRAINGGYARMDAGYVSQNIYLFCASSGLGTCAIGGVAAPGNPKTSQLKAALGLGGDKVVLLSHSVGHLAD